MSGKVGEKQSYTGWRERLAGRLFGDLIERRVQAAVKVVDDKWWDQVAGIQTTDRPWWEVREDLADILDAWRTNPLARRIVALTTDYVVGDGVTVTSQAPRVASFVDTFWHHRQNHMPLRLYEWCDELTRAGELFIVLSRNPADGMSYVRAIPAARIDQIEVSADDYETELRYHEALPLADSQVEGRWWTGVASALPADLEDSQVMVHYAVNRPVGALRGEGDLIPILPWLKRYKAWLEDRVRINKYKGAFLWDVAIQGADSTTLRQKQAQYGKPPEPGSIIVHDEKEQWRAVRPEVAADDAEPDGKAIRLMVAAGAGIPLHFLSEGESATRATAAEMGGPTFRHYAHRQLVFRAMLEDLVATMLDRAHAIGRISRPAGKASTNPWQLSSEVPEMIKADNKMLAEAAKAIVDALAVMKTQGWIDDQRAIALAFKFAGEIITPEEIRTILKPGGTQ
jgi:hypothetical protein